MDLVRASPLQLVRIRRRYYSKQASVSRLAIWWRRVAIPRYVNYDAFAVTTHTDAGSSTASPLANGVSASRIELGGGRAQMFRLAIQRPADRADFQRALHRAVEAAADRGIQRQRTRFHPDVGKAGLAENAAHTRLRGKRERPGIFRPLLRQFWHMFVGGRQRRHEERVFARLAPAGKCQPPRRA